MTPSTVISLAQVRKQKRARRVRPLARRAIVSFAIVVSLVGGVVLLGVAATALTPHNTLALIAALAIATAFGWPLSTMLIARLHRAHEAKLGRASRREHPISKHHPAARARSRMSANPLHPSNQMPQPPSRRRS